MVEKTIAWLGSQDIFREVFRYSLSSNHFAFESSKNTACFGSGTQVVQYSFLKLNDVGKGREVRGEA